MQEERGAHWLGQLRHANTRGVAEGCTSRSHIVPETSSGWLSIPTITAPSLLCPSTLTVPDEYTPPSPPSPLTVPPDAQSLNVA